MTSLTPLAFIAAIFLLAGFVKGVIGMGLPTVAVGLLGLTMPPSQAAAVLILPSLVTNVWQAFAGGHFRDVARRLWPMLVGICIGTWFGAMAVPDAKGGEATIWLGVALVITPASACATSICTRRGGTKAGSARSSALPPA